MDEAAKAAGPKAREQTHDGPSHLPTHLVLVNPEQSRHEPSAQTDAEGPAASPTAHPNTTHEPRTAVNPRERAAATAAAAAVASPTSSGTAPVVPFAAQPPPTPQAAVPTSSAETPVSRWAYAGMGGTSASGPTTSTRPAARPATSPAASSAASSATARTAAARAGASSARPAPTRTTTRASAPSQQVDRASFLRRTEVETPARHGWRGALNRFGLKVAPSADERAERADIAAVAAHWAGHRTVAVVNGKGGSSKSPTTALLCAAFARHGGTGVVAWENNQTRGTLGWRTEQGPHDATLLDLMPAVPDLLSRQAGLGDFAAYTHHQITDRYAVLRAQPKSLADEQRISPDDVTAVHEIAAKFNRLIVMDSGNDESDPMWRRMIDHTDQLVVPTTTRDDHAEAAALLLEGLARGDAHRARLAAGAVVVVSQADRSAGQADLDRVADGFADLAREVVTVRFDSAMVDGVLRWDTLHPTTQRDWLRAGAAVARGL